MRALARRARAPSAWYTRSIGHDACQPPGVKWVEGPVTMNAAAPVHPNLLGMLAASELVVAAVR